MNLLRCVDIIKATTVRLTGSSSALSKAIDMSGFEGCLFIAVGSTLTASNSSKMKLFVKSSTASGGTYTKSLYYAGSSSGLAAGVNKRLLCLDVYKPTERYLKAFLQHTTKVDAILAIRYGAKRPGSSALMNSTTVAGSTVYVSPTTA